MSTARAGATVGRRAFLGSLGALALLPELPESAHALDRLDRRLGAASPDQEAFWAAVRSSFSIPADRIYMNVGTLGPQPRVVVQAVEEFGRRVAASLPPPTDWAELKGSLGSFVGCDPEGLVFPRNTTEGMSFVANGLDWSSGDRVVTTDQEHIGGRSCWELAAARWNLELVHVPLPVPPDDPAEVLNRLESAITPRTRLVSVSHVTFTNGLRLPVADIVRLCRSRGVIAVLDGAHPPGMMELDIGEIDPDFYASSPHKWLCAPQGTGFLYVAEPWRTRLWPTVASGGWDDLELGAHRLNHMGSLDGSRLAGLLAAVAFQRAIGPERVAARVRELRAELIAGLSGIDGVRLLSPADDRWGAGMVSFTLEGVPGLELQRRLANAAGARTRVIGEFDLGWMRLSPHIYNTSAEIGSLVGHIEEIAAAG